jgi:hypothetical protein
MNDGTTDLYAECKNIHIVTVLEKKTKILTDARPIEGYS